MVSLKQLDACTGSKMANISSGISFTPCFRNSKADGIITKITPSNIFPADDMKLFIAENIRIISAWRGEKDSMMIRKSGSDRYEEANLFDELIYKVFLDDGKIKSIEVSDEQHYASKFSKYYNTITKFLHTSPGRFEWDRYVLTVQPLDIYSVPMVPFIGDSCESLKAIERLMCIVDRMREFYEPKVVARVVCCTPDHVLPRVIVGLISSYISLVRLGDYGMCMAMAGW